jgi:hypothetical protein
MDKTRRKSHDCSVASYGREKDGVCLCLVDNMSRCVGSSTVGVHKFTEFWILGISSWYTPSPLKSHNFTKYGRIRVLID